MPLELVGAVDLTMDGSKMVYSGKAFRSVAGSFYAGQCNNTNHEHERADQWLEYASNEVIQWKSKDGASIEGILLKPRN